MGRSVGRSVGCLAAWLGCLAWLGWLGWLIRQPFTWYNSKYTAASDFDNMNMTDGPGRTYKYLKDPTMATWPFGYGLVGRAIII